ncbi:MAG TPA: glutaredoxin [Gammaproteobacteria bacterium]|nr:glutaredoxin [Gammaproteobacteria bacterium]|tara:strand:+ start:633 stop:896 length:264 start_codon:yes stop_codon:yes gene_type:complete
MLEITIYTRQYCGYCTAAVHLLTSKNYEFIEIATDGDSVTRADIQKRSGQSTVPQIFIGEISVGGYMELAEAVSTGKFDELLSFAPR